MPCDFLKSYITATLLVLAVPKPGNSAVHPKWYEQEGAAKADTVVAIVEGLESDNSARRSRYLTNLQLYELRNLTGLNAGGYDTVSVDPTVKIPILRSLCDTVQADIAGRQRPVPMFMTSGADWSTRRRAKKLGKFVEAILHQPQGVYINAWELTCDVFLDACIYGVGVIHVYVDPQTDKVVLERVQPDEINVDAREAESGDPLNFFRTYIYDADKLFAEFEDELPEGSSLADLRAAIDRATDTDEGLTVKEYGSTRIAQVVKVREAFRMPISDDVPGQHVFAIPGFLLKEEEWERECPYVFFRWSRERRGFWGMGLIDEAKELAAELNESFERMQARQRLCANLRTYVPIGADIPQEAMQANEHENIIYYSGQQPPVVQATPALTDADVQWHQLVYGLCHKSPGVSEMSATSRKEPGLESGKALRTMSDINSKRFSVKARYCYEFPFVALARKIVAAVKEYHDVTERDVTARLPKRRGVQEIKWNDVSIDAELDVQIAPVSSLPSDPAGRLETVNELFAAQVIGPATYKRLLDWPDLEQEMSRDSAEWEYVESMLERFLDAKEGDEDVYVPPDGYLLKKEQALLQFSAAYFEARCEGAPEFNLELLRRYMQELSRRIEAAAMAQAALMMPPPMPGAGGAPAPAPAPAAPLPAPMPSPGPVPVA